MKRVISAILAFFLMWSLSPEAARAEDGIVPMASTTIVMRSASMDPGAKPGQLYINDDITAKNIASAVGVSSIVIYKSDGTYVTTIVGSEYNGLISSGIKHMGTYTYSSAISGQYYYAVVTVFATIGDVTDSIAITTATVKAP